MGVNKQDSRQTVHHSFLRKIANRLDFNTVGYNQLKQLLGAINAELSPAFEMYPTDPLDRVLHIGPNYVPNPETSVRHVNPPINKQFPTFTTGSVTLPAASGGTIVVTPTISPNPVLTISANAFIIGLIECDSLGNLSISLGTEGATEALALANFPGINSKAFQIGLLVIQTVAGAVQNVIGGRILQFSGGGGSGTGSASGTKQPIPGYQWMEEDTFDVTTASADSKVNVTAGYTNATQNLGKDLFQLSCDKSKTVNTSVGTAFTVSGGAPSFVVKAGDIVYMTSGLRVNQWRRISAIISQTSYTLDVAFTGGNAAPGDTFMVSQAVWSKDLVNLGSPSEKTRARDQFHGNILQIAVDYYDSLIANDNIPDFVDDARVVLSASNFGLVSDSGVPSSDNFAPIFTRQPYPEMIDDYILLANTAVSSTIVDNTSPDLSTQAVQANGNPHQAIAQPYTFTSGALLTDFRTIVTKSGTPSGNIVVSLVKDNGSGSPSLLPADLIGSTLIDVPSLPAGVSTVDITGLNFNVVAGQPYHIVFEGDASYKASFVAISTQVAIHANAAGGFTVSEQYDGTTWSSIGGAVLLFRFLGVAEQAARLFLTYFANPYNASVTGSANLVGYEASFELEEFVTNGGTLDSAYGYTDGSGSPQNCSISTPGAFTEALLDWSFVGGVNFGQTAGALRVYGDGEEIPRFVAGTTQDAYYTEVTVGGVYRMIRLHTDWSGYPHSLHVIRSEGVVDTSNTNSSRIGVLEEDKNVRITVATSVSVLSSDGLVLINCTAGNVNATMPSAIGISGKKIGLKKTDTSSNFITILTSLGQTLDFEASGSVFIYGPQDLIMFESDGANWRVIDRYFSRQTAIMYLGSNQAISNATFTKVDFTAANDVNDNGIADPSLDRILIKYTGRYDIVGNLSYQLNGAGTRWIWIYINGIEKWGLIVPASNDFKPRLSVSSDSVLLSAGDIVEMYTWQNSSGGLILDALNSQSNQICVKRVPWVGF